MEKEEGGGTFDEPTYKDLEHNGKYCEYGLAFPNPAPDDPKNLNYEALCSQVDKVMFDGEEI